MKVFFDGIFIDKEKLRINGIKYPIKLEYYKTIKTEQDTKKYGIQIVKTEFIGKKVVREIKEISKISEKEKEIENILNKFKDNYVTPITCDDILDDMLNENVYKYNIKFD